MYAKPPRPSRQAGGVTMRLMSFLANHVLFSMMAQPHAFVTSRLLCHPNWMVWWYVAVAAWWCSPCHARTLVPGNPMMPTLRSTAETSSRRYPVTSEWGFQEPRKLQRSAPTTPISVARISFSMEPLGTAPQARAARRLSGS
eukprot:67710-Pyramimonas_sp.AAC.1